MICTTCGTENRAGMRFCGHCGSALAVTCRSCQALNDATQLFCGQCGAKLGLDSTEANQARSTPTTATRPGLEPQRPNTERRHVSVLFADLVGFTALSESAMRRMSASC